MQRVVEIVTRNHSAEPKTRSFAMFTNDAGIKEVTQAMMARANRDLEKEDDGFLDFLIYPDVDAFMIKQSHACTILQKDSTPQTKQRIAAALVQGALNTDWVRRW